MELLALFDADFDWPAGRLRLYRPGEGEVVLHVALHVPHAPHLVSEEWLVLGSQVG